MFVPGVELTQFSPPGSFLINGHSAGWNGGLSFIAGSVTQSFDFLGFTHHWARSRRGIWVVMRKTAGGRFGRALKRASEWLRSVRHQPLAQQHEQLVRKLRGHDNYYGIVGNYESLARFHLEVRRAWRKWLDRRSCRARMTWARFRRLWQRYPLPAPVVRHRYGLRAANP